ncbi:MAG TPA: futalosine hydrolase [Puia sp.]|nr:futalosine hydrolase [Puia sp.]
MTNDGLSASGPVPAMVKIFAKVILSAGNGNDSDICSMYILLAAATPFEIQPAIDFLKGPGSISDAGSFSLPGSRHETDILITGVGSIATTWSLMRQIGRRKPDIIIQAGIAGCFTRKAPGEVVAIKEESLADLGVWEDRRFKTLFDLNLSPPDAPPFSNRLLVNPYKKLLALSGLEPVRAITVNEISTDKTRIEWIQQNTAPVVESMEGGGLHYVCLQEKIPFLQLRSVSNDIGERDKTKWDIRTAIANLNARLIDLFDKLAKEDPSSILKITAADNTALDQ